MVILLCEACGGTLEQIEGDMYICSYCGTKQIVTEDKGSLRSREKALGVSDKYNAACFAHSQAKNAKDYLCAARLFEEIKWYKNSAELMQDCKDRANTLQNDEIYNRAVEMMSESTPHFLNQAAELFNTIPEWKDSDELKEKCLSEISRLNFQITERNKRVEKRHERERRRNIVKYALIALLIIVAYATLYFLFI